MNTNGPAVAPPRTYGLGGTGGTGAAGTGGTTGGTARRVARNGNYGLGGGGGVGSGSMLGDMGAGGSSTYGMGGGAAYQAAPNVNYGLGGGGGAGGAGTSGYGLGGNGFGGSSTYGMGGGSAYQAPRNVNYGLGTGGAGATSAYGMGTGTAPPSNYTSSLGPDSSLHGANGMYGNAMFGGSNPSSSIVADGTSLYGGGMNNSMMMGGAGNNSMMMGGAGNGSMNNGFADDIIVSKIFSSRRDLDDMTSNGEFGRRNDSFWDHARPDGGSTSFRRPSAASLLDDSDLEREPSAADIIKPEPTGSKRPRDAAPTTVAARKASPPPNAKVRPDEEPAEQPPKQRTRDILPTEKPSVEQAKPREPEPATLLRDDEMPRQPPQPVKSVPKREPEPATLLPDDEAEIPLLVDDVRPPPPAPAQPVHQPSERARTPQSVQNPPPRDAAPKPPPPPQPADIPVAAAAMPEKRMPPGEATPALGEQPHPTSAGASAPHTPPARPKEQHRVVPSSRDDVPSDREPSAEVDEEEYDERQPEKPRRHSPNEPAPERVPVEPWPSDRDMDDNTPRPKAATPPSQPSTRRNETIKSDEVPMQPGEEEALTQNPSSRPDRDGSSPPTSNSNAGSEEPRKHHPGSRRPVRPQSRALSVDDVSVPDTASLTEDDAEQAIMPPKVDRDRSSATSTPTGESKEPGKHRPGSRRPVRPQSRALSVDEVVVPETDGLKEDEADQVIVPPKVDPDRVSRQRTSSAAVKPTDPKEAARIKAVMEEHARQTGPDDKGLRSASGGKGRRTNSRRSGSGLRGPIPDQPPDETAGEIVEDAPKTLAEGPVGATDGSTRPHSRLRKTPTGPRSELRGPIPAQPEEADGDAVPDELGNQLGGRGSRNSGENGRHSRRKTPTGRRPGSTLRGQIPDQPPDETAGEIRDALADDLSRPKSSLSQPSHHSGPPQNPDAAKPRAAGRPQSRTSGEPTEPNRRDADRSDSRGRHRRTPNGLNSDLRGAIPEQPEEVDGDAVPDDLSNQLGGRASRASGGDGRHSRRKTPTGRRPGSVLRGEIPEQPPDEVYGEIDDTAEGIQAAGQRSPTNMTATNLRPHALVPEYQKPLIFSDAGLSSKNAAPRTRNSWSGPTRTPVPQAAADVQRRASVPVSTTSTPRSVQPPLRPAAFVRHPRPSASSLNKEPSAPLSGSQAPSEHDGTPASMRERVPPPPPLSTQLAAPANDSHRSSLPPPSPSSTSGARALAPIQPPSAAPAATSGVPARSLFTPPTPRAVHHLPPVRPESATATSPSASQQAIQRGNGQTPSASQQAIQRGNGQTPSASQQSIQRGNGQTPSASQQAIQRGNGQTPCASQQSSQRPIEAPPTPDQKGRAVPPFQQSRKASDSQNATDAAPSSAVSNADSKFNEDENPVHTLVLVEQLNSSTQAIQHDGDQITYGDQVCTVEEVKTRGAGDFNYESQVARRVREAVCAGYNAAVLSNEAPNTASRFDSPVWSILNRIVSCALQTNTDETGQLEPNFTLCCAIGYICDDKVKDLLAEDDDSPFEKMSVHPSPIYGPRIPQLRYGQITSETAFEEVLTACLTRASENTVLSTMDRGVATALLLLKQVREENGVKDVYLSSILVASAGSDTEPYVSALNKAGNDYASVFHLVLGGPCLTCYMLNTADDDSVAVNGRDASDTQEALPQLLELLAHMTEFTNYRLRSGSVKRFIKYVEKANGKARQKLASASDPLGRRKLEKYVKDQERLLSGATRMLEAAGA